MKCHCPYSDSSGERFYLPRKWELSPDATPMVDIIKSATLAILFKQGEMKGSDLIRNLHWLSQFGGLMTLMDESEDELNSDNDDSEQNDDNNELIGNSKKRQRSKDHSQHKFEEEHNKQCPKWKTHWEIGHYMVKI